MENSYEFEQHLEYGKLNKQNFTSKMPLDRTSDLIYLR